MSKPKVLEQQHGGDHYKHLKIEPAEYAHQNNLTFLEGTVVKHVTRHRYKNKEEDIIKAIHYCMMILEMEYSVQSKFLSDLSHIGE